MDNPFEGLLTSKRRSSSTNTRYKSRFADLDLSEPKKPKKVNREKILNSFLDKGYSWEDISAKTGVDLDTIKSFSQSTRPNYGITPEPPKRNFIQQGGDFGAGIVDRVGGGLVRGGIRLGALASEVLPGEQRKAAERFIERNLENTTDFVGTSQESFGGRLGRGLGTGISAGTQIAGIGKAGALARGRAGVLLPSSRLGKVGTFTAGSLAETAAASGAMTAQGNDVNLAREAGTGLAVDIGLRGAGKVINRVREARKYKNLQEAGKSGDTYDDLVDGMISTTAAQKNKNSKGIINRFFQGGKEQLNVTTELRTIDRLKARRQNVNVSKLRKTESLEQAYDDVTNYDIPASNQITKQLSTGDSVTKVLQKHANDSEQFNVYRNAVAEKYSRSKGIPFRKDVTDDQLDNIIRGYELRVPTARQDIKTLNEAVNEARAVARSSGAITDDLDKRLGDSPDYTPVATVDTGAPRAMMGGRSSTTGKQGFVRQLSGPADVPLDNSFEPVLNYIRGAYKNSAQARLSQLLLDAHGKGLIKGSRVISEPGAKSMKRELTEYSRAVRKQADKLYRTVKVDKRQARVLSKEINDFAKEARDIRLKEGGKDMPDFTTNLLDQLKKQKGKSVSSRQFFKTLVEADPVGIERLKQKIALREPRLATKLDKVLAAQEDIAVLKSEARGAKQATFEIIDDSTTQQSFVRGLDENGDSFALELPADITRLLRGTDVTPQNPIMRTLLGVQRTFQTFWTGFANPVFNFVTAPLYDVAANVNALVDNPAAFLRSFSPEAFGKAITGMKNSDAFQVALRDAGAAPQGGSLMPQNITKSVAGIMSKRNFASRTGYLAKHPGEMVKALDQFSGKLGNATRTRIATGYYKEALKRNLPEVEALKEAAFAFNNIAPNFNRVSELARNANAFIPYFTAALSGNRSMWQPILAHPGRAAAVYGGIASTFIGATAYNLSTEAGQQFYQEMRDGDNQYVLDNNYIIVLPTASKNEETGEWTGIIKVPIAPEYRNINKLAHGSTQEAIAGESNLSPLSVASAFINTMIGGTGESVAQGPPALRTAQVLAGAKPTGSFVNPDPLIKGRLADKPKEEQMYPWTSNPAKFFSSITGRKISPIQADAIIRQFGAVGRATTGQGIAEQVRGRFGGAFTQSLPSQAYEQTAPSQQSLSQRMKESNTGLSGARALAIEHNRKVDDVIDRIRNSSLTEATKKEEIEKLEKRKASLETWALQRRLE